MDRQAEREREREKERERDREEKEKERWIVAVHTKAGARAKSTHRPKLAPSFCTVKIWISSWQLSHT